MGSVIGIDLGERRIGVSVSDSERRVAVALTTLEKERKTSDRIRRLCRLAEQKQSDQFVLGLPLNMDGSEGESAQKARAFGERLGEKSGLPVAFVDERLTTVQAQRALYESEISRDRRKAVVDEASAVLILQSWLDSRGRSADAS